MGFNKRVLRIGSFGSYMHSWGSNTVRGQTVSSVWGSWKGSWEMVDWCWILYWDSLVKCRIAPEADVSQNMSVSKMTLLPTFSHGLVSAENVGGSWATSNPELATMWFTTFMESCWLEWSKSEEFCNYCSITWASAENNCIQKNEDLMYYEP